jgi:transposase
MHLWARRLNQPCSIRSAAGSSPDDDLFDGPIDGESFRTYVERVLVPTLRPGDIVIMDNLGSHKAKAVRQLIRAAGAKLFFLPKYSPDLNPIEQVFAKIKHFLRKAAARSVETICTAIGEILGALHPTNAPTIFKIQASRKPKGIML